MKRGQRVRLVSTMSDWDGLLGRFIAYNRAGLLIILLDKSFVRSVYAVSHAWYTDRNYENPFDSTEQEKIIQSSPNRVVQLTLSEVAAIPETAIPLKFKLPKI